MNASMQSGTPEYHGDDDPTTSAVDDHQGELPTSAPEERERVRGARRGSDRWSPGGDTVTS